MAAHPLEAISQGPGKDAGSDRLIPMPEKLGKMAAVIEIPLRFLKLDESLFEMARLRVGTGKVGIGLGVGISPCLLYQRRKNSLKGLLGKGIEADMKIYPGSRTPIVFKGPRVGQQGFPQKSLLFITLGES